MGLDVFDYECEGQMSFEDLFELPEDLFAVSKIFARAKKQMNVQELKAFTYALSNIRFTETNGNKIMLDKKTLANIVGVHSDPDHLSQDLKSSIGKLPKHSYIEVENEDKDFFESGVVVTSLRMYKNRVCITLNQDYMPLFENLERDYITMWSGDIFQMSSERSITFYEDLRLATNTKDDLNYKGFGVKALKELFGIPKDGKGSYMRKDGHFDRQAFERFVIDPLCEDLAKCKMINMVMQEDGKYYEKVKNGSRVLGYRFYWTYSSRPRVIKADELKSLKDEIAKDPQILKVAKDIVEGKKKKPKVSKNGFTDYSGQRNYDYEELEKRLFK